MGHFSCRIPRGGGDILVKATESDLELRQYRYYGCRKPTNLGRGRTAQ
jgi:hypothetical protein